MRCSTSPRDQDHHRLEDAFHPRQVDAGRPGDVLRVRKSHLYSLSPTQRNRTLLPPQDMQRRIEEDRERHKRLRERSWILPPTALLTSIAVRTRPEQLDPTYLTRRQPASPRSRGWITMGTGCGRRRIWI